jgi:TRAP-type mannitol/chloroaromatic compound transport system permease small subunit
MRLLNIVDQITSGAALLGICGLPPLIAIMVFEVFSRYVLNAPTIWAFELSWMLMGFIFIMGIAYAMKRRDHVSVDLIYGGLSARKRAIVDAVGYALLLPCIGWLAYRMAMFALAGFVSGEVSGTSAWTPVLWPFRTALAAGLTVFALQLIAELIRALQVAVVGSKKAPSA